MQLPLSYALLCVQYQNRVYYATRLPCKQQHHYHNTMTKCFETPTIKVPMALAHLIAINVVYKVVLCMHPSCHRAISPVGVVEHLRKFHQTPPKVRKRVQDFVQSLLWSYDYSSILLPTNGLAPQPVLPVVEGFYY